MRTKAWRNSNDLNSASKTKDSLNRGNYLIARGAYAQESADERRMLWAQFHRGIRAGGSWIDPDQLGLIEDCGLQ